MRRAKRRAAHRIAFIGHVIVWASVCLFLSLVAGPFVGATVALSWGIGVASHGFFGVVAPVLRQRWVEREVGQRLSTTVTHERRALEGRHARALEQLSASVAHEIRNPITAAKSLVQQIAEDPTHAGNAEYAKVAAAELDRVERSVSHLLRYAREEPLSLREVDMEEVVDSALETLRERLTKTDTSVQKSLEPDTWLEADPDKLRRVLLNLFSNALDALEDSSFPSPSIEIAGGANLSGNELWLRVRDNGPGIEAERLPKIFDPFHTSKERGTGLGLAITRKLVEAHGGSIDVESKLGEGTTFSLVFPRHREHGGA
ncbi:MAG TPA: ATP-binding protein [Polyangiaceae bacterium]